MKAKKKNLQPWLDYFEMLQTYETKGLLEMKPDKHEAYITEPALFALTKAKDLMDAWQRALAACETPIVLRRIRTYAGWKSLHDDGYLSRPFALHVVRDEEPHDLLYTIVITSRRRWWKLWMWHDSIEIIEYGRTRF